MTATAAPFLPYACERCGHRSTLAASWDHDKSACTETDWLAAEGYVRHDAVRPGDRDQLGRLVTAVEVSKSGKRVRIFLKGFEGARWEAADSSSKYTRP